MADALDIMRQSNVEPWLTDLRDEEPLFQIAGRA